MDTQGAPVKIQRLRITGMTCTHCAQTLEDALNELPGIKARVSFDEAIERVQAPKGVDTKDLIKAVITRRLFKKED
ncbi:MAG: cation transporter [Gammaproteobacteria bacterium]